MPEDGPEEVIARADVLIDKSEVDTGFGCDLSQGDTARTSLAEKPIRCLEQSGGDLSPTSGSLPAPIGRRRPSCSRLRTRRCRLAGTRSSHQRTLYRNLSSTIGSQHDL